jgi:hypothetical protein
MDQHRGGKNDPIVVRSADFKPYLEAYIDEWRRSWRGTDEDDDNEIAEHHRGRDRITPAGALEVLSDESGIMQRRILAIRKGETQYTSLRSFDLIITAMGMPALAQELTLWRNPLWSTKHFIEWLGEQDLTPEDINVRRWPPGTGFKHLERTTRRIQTKRAKRVKPGYFSVKEIVS